MKKHADTFLEVKELGKKIPPYQPTYEFSNSYIDSYHQYLAESPLQENTLVEVKTQKWFGKVIPGWLRREDALKIYELSYFAKGDILELGSYHGLSTSIIAQAVCNSKQSNHLYSIDLSSRNIKAAKNNLQAMGLDKYTTMICDDGVKAVNDYARKKRCFDFVFIDHSHAYEPVYKVCVELANIMASKTFCLFHDFNDHRNSNPDDNDYGVYQAVLDGLDQNQFEFYGIYGCTGLYRLN
ncbi:MAG: class I SAM-dependent methyltransferase [Desulfobacteraceae bacterium]|jgi:hypothetical protein|nr:class I SAM-dependent methyltransferase [Desulfobacteraceae bacterium]